MLVCLEWGWCGVVALVSYAVGPSRPVPWVHLSRNTEKTEEIFREEIEQMECFTDANRAFQGMQKNNFGIEKEEF